MCRPEYWKHSSIADDKFAENSEVRIAIKVMTTRV